MGHVKKRIITVACVVAFLTGMFPANLISAATKTQTLVLNKATCVMKKGEKRKLKATISVNDLNGSVKWTSSNWKVASVSQRGVVEAKKKGKATIRVTAGGQKASCKIIVGTPIKKLKVSQKKVSLAEGTTTRLEASVVPAKASVRTLKYSSKNKKVATVSKKGLIRGIGKGTTKITVRSTDGSNRSAVVKVKVSSEKSSKTQQPVNVTVNPVINVVCPTPMPANTVKVSGIRLSDTERSLNLNEKAQLTASVMPEGATDKSVTWRSSDTSIATVSDNGLVTPEGEGTAEISVSTADGLYTAVCEVTVSPTAVVSTNAEISYALSKKNLKTLEVSSETTKKLTIPKGTYENVDMVVDLPNGELENNGVFKSVTVEEIAEDTYFENAIGNIIKVLSKKSHIIIDENASATVIISKESKETAIENNGVIKKLEISTTGKVDITGQSKEKIPVQIAAEVTISTTQKLAIDSSSHFDITIRPGAESTEIAVDLEVNMPDIFGLGVISVKITATGEIKTVISENNGTDKLAKNVKFSGSVRDVDGNAVQGAEIYIVPYVKEYDMKDIWSESSAVRLTTDADGEYSTSNKIKTGHYYLAARKEGYMDVPQQIILIESTYGDTYTNEEIILLPADWEGKTGNVTGKILDSAVKDLALSDIAVRIRKGKGTKNSDDEIENETRTDAKGMYQFNDLEVGYYTIELEDDKIISADGKAYLKTWVNVLIRPDETVTEGAVMSKTLLEKQLRFVLSWGSKDSGAVADLDAHLRGPGGYENSDYRFHTFYSNKNYNNEYGGEKSHADLDVDDMDYEGPETTTIYESAPGIYSYYVHDYSNSDSRDSTRLSESSVKVEVYSGNDKLNTYYIPQKEGTVWHVFDYDSNTETFKTVNTMYYESSPWYVGDTVEEYKQRALSYLASAEGYRETLEEGTGDDISEKIAVYQKQFDLLTDKKEAEAARLTYEVLQYWNSLYNDCSLYCSADGVYSYSHGGNYGEKLILYVEKKDYEPTVDTIHGQDEAVLKETAPTDPDAWKAFQVTAKNGHARLIHVYLEFDPNRLSIQGARSGEVSLDWQTGRSYNDGTEEYSNIYLYSWQGKEFDLKDVTFTFSPDTAKVTYDSQKVEGEYTVTAQTDSKTRTWIVRKMPDPQIKDVDNNIYKMTRSGNSIYVYADNKVLSKDCVFEVNGKQYDLEKDKSGPDYSYYHTYTEEGISYNIYCYSIDDICTLTDVSFNQNVLTSVNQADCSVTVTAGSPEVGAEDLSLYSGTTGNGGTEVEYEAVDGEEYCGKITVTLEGVKDYSKVYKVYFKPYQQS